MEDIMKLVFLFNLICFVMGIGLGFIGGWEQGILSSLPLGLMFGSIFAVPFTTIFFILRWIEKPKKIGRIKHE